MRFNLIDDLTDVNIIFYTIFIYIGRWWINNIIYLAFSPRRPMLRIIYVRNVSSGQRIERRAQSLWYRRSFLSAAICSCSKSLILLFGWFYGLASLWLHHYQIIEYALWFCCPQTIQMHSHTQLHHLTTIPNLLYYIQYHTIYTTM